MNQLNEGTGTANMLPTTSATGMLYEPSHNHLLNHQNAAASTMQQQAVGPLPFTNSNTNAQAQQLVQALNIQQHQQQLQMQLQLQLQQAAVRQPFAAPQTQQQQQLVAQWIANAASAIPQAPSAAALQSALLLQQQQQQQQQQLAAAALMTHNLIPKHLQATSLAASLDGTPGYQPALISSSSSSNNILTNNTTSTKNPCMPNLISSCLRIPFPLTVQDDLLLHPNMPPIYNGVNLQYPGLRQLHSNPPVYAVDHFLTPAECQFLIHAASDVFQPAPVVGNGQGEISASRTSSTCYLAREDLPEYLRKVRLLTGKPISHCELPQVGRYFPSQQYLQHFDAFDLSDENGRRFASNGGQRVVTVLVYLNTLTEEQGGATHFPNLNIKVQPQQGMALVFFPSTVDGLLDRQALHAALPPTSNATKYVSQVWIRQSEYKGDASKRLNPIMGIPNYQPPTTMEVLQLKAAAKGTAVV